MHSATAIALGTKISHRVADVRGLRAIAGTTLTAVAVVLSGCSSTGGGGGAPLPVPVTASAQRGGGSGSMSPLTMVVENTGQKATVGASRDDIWAKLPGAYESLGLPLSFKDDARFRLGNDLFKARRAINGLQMRALLDCGSDLAGEKAESYEIKLSIETTVASSNTPGSAEVTTTVSGLGRSPSYGAGDVNCGTKGELERRILQYVRVQLGLKER